MGLRTCFYSNVFAGWSLLQLIELLVFHKFTPFGVNSLLPVVAELVMSRSGDLIIIEASVFA